MAFSTSPPQVAEIRPAELADLPALLRLIAAHAAFEQAPQPDATLSGLQQALFSPSPALHLWMLWLEGAPMGYASASLEFSTWRARPYFHLDCLYVQPKARGQGWGRQLFAQVTAAARTIGCDEIQWQTPAWNTAAAGFYDHLGGEGTPKLRYRLNL